MSRIARLVAVVAVFAMLAAACASNENGGGGGGTTSGAAKPGEGMSGCEVTDTGGIDDKSFNATAYKGLTDAQDQLGITAKYLESQTQQDYQPNIQAFIDQKCNLIITVGFLLGDATEAAAKANPDQDFAIVDFAYEKTYPNLLGLTFQTDQAAFLAGYLAAGMTQTDKVGTFGGLNIPTVSIFMNGFWAGVQKYNQDNSTSVLVLGWDAKKQNGTFTGDFENQDNGRRVTEDLIGEGADIILPVAGPVGLGAAAAAQDAGNVNLIWVDTDGCVSASEYCPLFLTSVEKKMDVAVFDSMKAVIDGTFQGGVYSGTLENSGVDIAPYHEWDSKIPADLKSKIDELKQGIIDGTVSADYKDYL
ncbi:MAG TPA: BMP family ABC transporter substrate-binding protein [Actinomycetota bacterium]